MRRTLLLFLAIGCFCFGLKAADPESGRIDLDRAAKGKCAFRSEVIRILPLETTDESLLSKADKILCRNPYIYILDSKQKAIVIFNYDGTYADKIRRIGRGGGEYIDIRDFDLADNGDLYVLSAFSKKIIKYEFPGYDSFEQIPIRNSMAELCVAGERIYVGDVYTRDGIIGLGVLNPSTGDVEPLVAIRKEFDIPSVEPLEVKSVSFYKSSEGILFNQRFSRHVLELNKEGRGSISCAFESKLPALASDGNSDFRGFRSIYRTNGLTVARLWQNKPFYPPLYVRDSKNNRESLCNTWDLGLPFLSELSIKDDRFIMAISAENLLKIEGSKLIKSKIPSVSENDNPLILEFRITATPQQRAL